MLLSLFQYFMQLINYNIGELFVIQCILAKHFQKKENSDRFVENNGILHLAIVFVWPSLIKIITAKIS